MIHVLPHEVPNLANYWTLAKISLAQLNKLTPHQFIALGLVAAQGIMSFKELRRVLALPMSSFTFLVDRLEKRILVKRERAVSDRRQWLLRVTPDGRRLVSDMKEKEPAVLQSLLSLVPADEKAELSQALNRLSSFSKEDNQTT